MAGIRIPFFAEVRDFLRGTRDVSEALEDVSDSLDDLTRDAARSTERVSDDFQDAGRDIERSMDDAARETDDATEKMERSFREAFDAVKRESKKASDSIADDTRHAVTERGGEAVGEFKDEARQNFGEVASSFSGDIDSAADLVQGTLGGLAGSLAGPAGLAAGVLAGIGGAMWNSFKENAEKSEARISDMFEDMMESGLRYLSDEAVIEGINAIYQGSEDAAVSLNKATGYASDLGVEVSTVVAAFAGSRDAQREVNDALAAAYAPAEELEAKLQEALDTQGYWNEEQQAQADALHGQFLTYQDIQEGIGAINSDLETAIERTDGARAAAERWTETGRRSREEREREAEAMRQINDRYRTLEQSGNINKTVVVEADLSAAERAIRNWRPVITGVVRAGQAVV